MDRNKEDVKPMTCSAGVALRKESVDRNRGPRRSVHGPVVALRKESVDRNTFSIPTPHHPQRRSPQGERG